MDQVQKTEIVEMLRDKGATLPCPRCGKVKFDLIDGYLNTSFGKEMTAGLVIGGATMPSVVIVCKNCGFISQHALGALNLLPSKRKERQ